MREWKRVLFAAISAAGLFLLLFLALKWHPLVALALSVGLYGGVYLLLAPKAKELLVVKSALVSNERVQVPAWLEIDIEKLQGSVLSLPTRDQIDLDINEQLIVELYSK